MGLLTWNVWYLRMQLQLLQVIVGEGHDRSSAFGMCEGCCLEGEKGFC